MECKNMDTPHTTPKVEDKHVQMDVDGAEAWDADISPPFKFPKLCWLDAHTSYSVEEDTHTGAVTVTVHEDPVYIDLTMSQDDSL